SPPQRSLTTAPVAHRSIGAGDRLSADRPQYPPPPDVVFVIRSGCSANFCTRQSNSSPVQISFSATPESACTQPNWPDLRPAVPNCPTSLPSSVNFCT